ncbi:MAG: TRAP transporter large permease [Desulfovermiculus sp.]|nr:TRAP transporter large permease [Desulfovermiculus sp.]
MDNVTVGLLGVCLLLLLFLLRVHIAFAMAMVGTFGYAYLMSFDAGMKILVRDVFEQFSSYPLTVIPAFVLMGCYAFASGISERLYKAANAWFGQLSGGLTLATIVACAAFAAICGSTSATVATMGKIALPEMRKFNYKDTLSTGSIASSATLGILIPPSTVFIVYGILTEQSIGDLFVAGIVPGIILTILFALTVVILCYLRPSLGPKGPSVGWKEKFRSLTGIIEALILFLLTIGGLFLGWFTPTQAGSIGAAGAIMIGVVRRKLSWKDFVSSTKDGLQISCMILWLIAGATVFGHFMTISRVPLMLMQWVQGLPFSAHVIMIFICLLYFLGGLFIDAMALIVLTIPFIFPVVLRLGFDPIWFGVIIVLVSGVGVISPPVGVNAYVMKGLAPEIPLASIFKGISYFILPIIVCIAILMVFPGLTTLLT